MLLRINFRVKILLYRHVFIMRLLMEITTNGETQNDNVLHQT